MSEGKSGQLKFWDPAEAFRGCHYRSLSYFEKIADAHSCDRRTLLRYMLDWKKAGKVFSAGRGWYSDIARTAGVEGDYIEPIVELMSCEYPTAPFTVWSTYQLSQLHHHLPMRYTTFLSVERWGMREIAARLKAKRPELVFAVNPSSREADYLERPENLVVVRPLRFDDRVEAEGAHTISIEKMLVDYAVEAERLSLVDSAEYHAVLDNALDSGRLNVNALLLRVSRRHTVNRNTENIKGAFGEVCA